MRSSHTISRAVLSVAAASALLLGITGVADAASVENGSFESGDFTGWETTEWPGSGGEWLTSDGGVLPYSGHDAPTPACGEWAAVTDQGDPASSVLYQEIVLEDGQTHSLSLQYYYDNWYEGGFITPDTLEIQRGDPLRQESATNQQFRIDIMSPDTVDDFSVSDDDVLEMVFRTEVGDPDSSGGWQDLEVDLTPWAGQTVYLRFATADDGAPLHSAVDCIEVASQPLPTTTTTSTTTTTAPPAAAAPATAAAPTFTG